MQIKSSSLFSKWGRWKPKKKDRSHYGYFGVHFALELFKDENEARSVLHEIQPYYAVSVEKWQQLSRERIRENPGGFAAKDPKQFLATGASYMTALGLEKLAWKRKLPPTSAMQGIAALALWAYDKGYPELGSSLILIAEHTGRLLAESKIKNGARIAAKARHAPFKRLLHDAWGEYKKGDFKSKRQAGQKLAPLFLESAKAMGLRPSADRLPITIAEHISKMEKAEKKNKDDTH